MPSGDLPPLPPIPEKKYFTIGEAAELCAVKPHVLRYWEQEFPQLKPATRRGNRRYYQRHEVLLVRRIKALLHGEGYTAQGVRKRLANERREQREQPIRKGDLAQVGRQLERALKILEG